jgi:organic radical activating enzyme
MGCIYCGDWYSSRIQQENIKFGVFESNGIKIANRSQRSANFDKNTQVFWEWLDQNHTTLRRFHILGGEPFYQQQFETCLNFLETHSSPELEFNIVSNLKISHEKFKKIIGRIKNLTASRNIKRFDLTCSIDCWGDEQEYIRYGIDMEEWRKNFEFLVDQKWIVLNINQTITGLSIKSMPSLIEYINHHRQTRKIGHYFMTVNGSRHLYPGIFGSGFFDQDFDKILKVMPNDTWQHQHAHSMMRGLQLEFNTTSRDSTEILKLETFLDEMDRRRNLNWKKTFPWLEREINNVV